ncbi:MAG: hypothetical protein AB7L66_17620 [Gemmatimonadales bacterium]
MATYNRVKVKVGSVEFRPVEARYTLSRNANQVGRRVGDSLIGRLQVWMDASVLDNLPQSTQIELWKIATESKDPLHKVEVTWYLDEADKVLHAVEFMGWICGLEVKNPQADVTGDVSRVQFKNLMWIEFAVVVDESNVTKHKFTK